MIDFIRRWRQQRRAAVLRALVTFTPSTSFEIMQIVSTDLKNTFFVFSGGVQRTLLRFEEEGLVTSFTVPPPPAVGLGTRATRYYELTERGRSARDALLLAARVANQRRPR